MRLLIFVTWMLACPAGAQTTAVYPPMQPNFQDVAAYLNLSGTQLESLKTIQGARNRAQQGIVQAINQKQEQLNSLLSGSESSVAEIGQLSVDLYNLRKQLTPP